METTDIAPVADRAKLAVAQLQGKHGYSKEDGSLDTDKLTAVLRDPIVKAEAKTLTDRPTIAIRRRQLVEIAFPGVPGPEAYSEQPDPELAKETYKLLDNLTFGLTTITGKLQQQLNSGLGLVLCRTKVNPDSVEAVYVTRDTRCILEDIYGPINLSQDRQATKHARATALVMSRLPDAAETFKRNLLDGMKAATDHAKAIVAPAAESAAAARESSSAGE